MKVSFFSSWLSSAVMFLAIPSLAFAEPTPLEAKKIATEAITNARQIGLMLFEFETEYGAFPSDETLKHVEESSGIKLPADDKTANAMFRQCFAGEYVANEALFFAKIPGAKKGDGLIEIGKALAKGENAFCYIAGLSTAGNPARPLVVCPLIPGTTKFDPKPFGGKAVILRVDNSVQLLPIEANGVVMEKGVDLLSQDNPLWDGKAPDIRYPDLLAVEE